MRGEGEGESNLLKKEAGAYVFSDNVMFLLCCDCKLGIIIKKRVHTDKMTYINLKPSSATICVKGNSAYPVKLVLSPTKQLFGNKPFICCTQILGRNKRKLCCLGHPALKWSSVKTFLLTEDEKISRKSLTRRGARAESYSCETE